MVSQAQIYIENVILQIINANWLRETYYHCNIDKYSLLFWLSFNVILSSFSVIRASW